LVAVPLFQIFKTGKLWKFLEKHGYKIRSYEYFMLR
jgi:hypothetical protein